MKTITEDGEILDTVTHETIAMAPPFFKTPWNHDRDAESHACGLACTDKSKTQQQFAKDSDINVILAKFVQTGELNLIGVPIYQDAEKPFDLQEAIVTQYEVEQAWNALPAKVRNTLKDPQTFVDYINHAVSTGDLDDLRDLGLAPAKASEPANPGGASSTPPGKPEEPAKAGST